MFFGIFVRNLKAMFGRRTPLTDSIVTSPGQIILSACIFLAVTVATGVFWYWPIGGVNTWGVVSFLASSFVTFAGIAVAAVLTGQSARLPIFLFGLPICLTFGLIAMQFYWYASMDVPQSWTKWVVGVAIMFGITAISALKVFAENGLKRALLSVPLLAILFGLEIGRGMLLPQAPLFETASAEVDNAAPEYFPVDIEALYYAQPDLMAQQIDGLRPETSGQIDLFAVTLGGTAYQNVFLREVDAVSTMFETKYDASARVIRLANSTKEPTKYPLANKRNLDASLQAIASKMDPAEDIAFLFLTSHGGEDVFSLSFYEAGTESLSARELAAMLDGSGLQNIVMVLSACYSGSFIDDLEGPGRMIITASAEDRTSFGCADKNEWTWWGEAYFSEALTETPDFRKAFPAAKSLVSSWEQEMGFETSDPQISIGEDIDRVLDSYFAQRMVQG